MADFTKAAQAGLITPDQAEALTKFFAEGTTTPAPARPRFDLPHVLWYAGALLIMGAMSWFTTLGFARMGGGFLVGVGVLYALAARWRWASGCGAAALLRPAACSWRWRCR